MDLEEDFKQYVAQTSPFSMALPILRARGIYLYTTTGDAYLDFTSGIAVANLGYSNPAITEAITHQVKLFTHTNVYGEHIQAPQVELARRILSFFPERHQIFFTNSGTEGNELALKMARKFTRRESHAALVGGFHGRTFGSMSISWNEKYRQGFGKLLPTRFFERNNILPLVALDTENFASLTVELVQGEAGAYPLDKEFVEALKQKCDETGTYLIFDEVQTGFGRTGEMFAQEYYGVTPDFTVLGKAMGGGLPLGGVVAKKSDFEELQDPPFSHVTTFGGNPLSCAAGIAVIREIEKNDILQQVKQNSELFTELLESLQRGYPETISEHRGLGYLRGLEFYDETLAHVFVEECFRKHLILGYKLNNPRTIRLAPPLVTSPTQLEKAFEIMRDALEYTQGVKDLHILSRVADD